MAASVRSHMAVAISTLAATAIALPAITPSMPAPPASHTVTIVSDAPARAFAVRLLNAVEQTTNAAASAKRATPASAGSTAAVPAAAVSAAAIANPLPAVGVTLWNVYEAALTVVNTGVSIVSAVAGAVPIVGSLVAPQIEIIAGAIETVTSSIVYNFALTVALTRDPVTAVSSILGGVANAALSFVEGELSWAAGLITLPLSLVGLAATKTSAGKAAATTTAKPTAAALSTTTTKHSSATGVAATRAGAVTDTGAQAPDPKTTKPHKSGANPAASTAQQASGDTTVTAAKDHGKPKGAKHSHAGDSAGNKTARP